MTRKKDAPQGQVMGQKWDCADCGDQSLLQYTPCSSDFQRQLNAVRRMMVDAFVMSRQFPARLRFSYFVDQNGSLEALSDGRAEG